LKSNIPLYDKILDSFPFIPDNSRKIMKGDLMYL
jgi:hypothetical protein